MVKTVPEGESEPDDSGADLKLDEELPSLVEGWVREMATDWGSELMDGTAGVELDKALVSLAAD